jgi:hypothetical protein
MVVFKAESLKQKNKAYDKPFKLIHFTLLIAKLKFMPLQIDFYASYVCHL